MLWNLGGQWLFMAVFTVGAVSFILSLALDRIMGDDGFGAWGNTAVIMGGFFLAIFATNLYGRNLADIQIATAVGVSGAFVTLAVLTLCKAMLLKL